MKLKWIYQCVVYFLSLTDIYIVGTENEQQHVLKLQRYVLYDYVQKIISK